MFLSVCLVALGVDFRLSDGVVPGGDLRLQVRDGLERILEGDGARPSGAGSAGGGGSGSGAETRGRLGSSSLGEHGARRRWHHTAEQVGHTLSITPVNFDMRGAYRLPNLRERNGPTFGGCLDPEELGGGVRSCRIIEVIARRPCA